MDTPVKPLEDPIAHSVGQFLVEHNIVYPEWSKEGVLYRPQYPVYKAILDLAVEKHVSSLFDLDVREVYKSALSPKQRDLN